MNIKEAIDEAMPPGKMITRYSWEKENMRLFLIPTNTSAGIILHNPAEKEVKHKLCPGWQPQSSDLQANDWVVRG